MKSCLQVLFLVLMTVSYLLGVRLFWIGVYPEENFASAASAWETLTPLFVLVTPVVAFAVFTLGYDPKTQILQHVRNKLVSILQSKRWLGITLGTLVVLVVAQIVWLQALLAIPQQESYLALIGGDYENAALLAESNQPLDEASQVILLTSQAEIEAKRRVSSSEDQNSILILRDKLLDCDHVFAPIWIRFLSNYGLGKLAFARKDINAIKARFTRAASLSRNIDDELQKKSMRAMASAYFSLSQTETDPEKSKTLIQLAQNILQADLTIPSQRLLASISYINGDFGGAFRTWKAMLDRKEGTSHGLNVPDAIERKRLLNNMALAKLRLDQPESGLELVKAGLAETWKRELESDRTEQVRLMATHILCLLGLNRPSDALTVFESRTNTSNQLREEGLSTGSLLLKANILVSLWRDLDETSKERKGRANEILGCLLLVQDPSRKVSAFNDHSKAAYQGLVAEAKSLWRWHGIEFDGGRCEQAIISLLK